MQSETILEKLWHDGRSKTHLWIQTPIQTERLAGINKLHIHSGEQVKAGGVSSHGGDVLMEAI